MEPYHFSSGDQPVLVSIPHVGRYVPEEIRAGFSEAARALPDTDWHLDRLYGWAQDLEVSVISSIHSRYVIDLNRPPDDEPLYNTPTTGLCPTVLFDGTPLYQLGCEPDKVERQHRLKHFWQPYHARLAEELERLKAKHGFAILYDAHSIRSQVPRLFEGTLPDFNVGTNDGLSAAVELTHRVTRECEQAEGYSSVLNGRFKGGYITRHYGNPSEGVHAIQMELSQQTYMEEEPPFTYREDLAAQVQPTLRRVLEALVNWVPEKIG